MVLTITSGEAGVGKTEQHVALSKMLPKAIYLCMEIKDDKALNLKGINFVQIIQFDANFNEDPVETLHKLEMSIRDIIHSDTYSNVIIDGISDIRKFAMKEWIYRDNQIRISERKPPRSTISGENKAAWGTINQRVISVLEPLINWSNLKRTNVFFTAQMKDNYVNDVKVGRAVAAGDWIEYDVDTRCMLYIESGEYYAKFTKVPLWAARADSTVPIMREGYIGLLAERGLI